MTTAEQLIADRRAEQAVQHRRRLRAHDGEPPLRADEIAAIERQARRDAAHQHLIEDSAEKYRACHDAAIFRMAAKAAARGAEPEKPAQTSTAVDGASFIFDQTAQVPAIWGRGNDVLWAAGESLMIAGGMGLGKTTLAILLVRAQLGCIDQVLGLPVADSDGRILYLAMDRPRQIARAAARQFTEADRDILAERLVVRPGPPPKDIARHPEILCELAVKHNAEIVFIDSVKDAAIGLSSDEVGAGYNRARQALIADGRQVCDLHHNVKRGPEGQAPSGVADVYGSTWLTSGAGSVIMLTGEPGDPIIKMRHVKQPANEVGPWLLEHDHDNGMITVSHETDLVAMAAASGPEGITARVAATIMFVDDSGRPPKRAEVEKARRALDRLVKAGALVCVEGSKGGQPGSYFPAAAQT